MLQYCVYMKHAMYMKLQWSYYNCAIHGVHKNMKTQCISRLRLCHSFFRINFSVIFFTVGKILFREINQLLWMRDAALTQVQNSCIQLCSLTDTYCVQSTVYYTYLGFFLLRVIYPV